MASPSKKIKALVWQAQRIASAHVEYKARKILSKHQNLHEFVMGMGVWGFTEHKHNDFVRERRYMQSLANFIGDFDESLHITGEPMRFTANGKKITDW